MKKRRSTLLSAASGFGGAALLVTLGWAPAVAGDTTKVSGTITDAGGKPLAKVEVFFENAKIKEKKVGPVKTNKNGRYIHPFLDVGIEPEWRVVPRLPGYMVLKVKWKLVDSERQDRGSNEVVLNSKQEFPAIHPVPVGSEGVNEVDFVMVKEEEFAGALRGAAVRKPGGSAPEAGAASPAGSTPGGEAPFPAPPAAAGKSVGEALELLKAGKNEEAIPILKDYLEKTPNNAPIQFTLGKAYIVTKQYDLAIPPLAKSLAIDAGHAGSHFFLGIAYSEMGQDDDALKEFLAEIPISPNQDAAYSNAASIYEKQGKLDPAIEYYRKAVEINPTRAEMHASLAGLYEKKGDQAKAETEYKALADVDPAHASVTWYNIGAIARNNRKNGEAVRAFSKAVELDPQYAMAHRELGYALVQQGDFAAALTHFKKYLELAPKASDATAIQDTVRQLSH